MHSLLTTCAIGPVPAAEQERLALILDEYLQGLERGRPIEPDELLARHPDVADRLRGYLSGLKLFHHAVAERAASGGQELQGQLGDFRLIREIGRGGMGVVYEGEQVSLGRRVALKVLPASLALHETQIARFKNEAQAAAQIDHPNIVPVFAIGHERGIHYFAMQLIGGQSLGQLLEQLRKDAAQGDSAARTLAHVQNVAGVGVQIAEALHAAHEIGVVHRDVKPSNLLLDEKGKAWITDFGVARCKTSDELTETGQTVGTMAYMSPEQAGGNPALVDQRTDIYSLGMTLYELATLRHPAEAAPDAATAFQLDRSHWRPPRLWNPAIPADFEVIVQKAIAEERDERYATARELADDLERFLRGEPILARPPTLGARLSKWACRRKRLVAAAGGVLAAAVLGLAVSLAIITSERSAKDLALREATLNHAKAEQKFREARQMLDQFGAQVAEGLANEVPGSEGVRKRLLRDMLPYYRQFASEAAGDPQLQADLATTFSKIGDLSDQIDSLDDAERAYREAQKILERLVQQQPASPQHVRSLGLCCNNLGQLLQKRGDNSAARVALERALSLQQRLALSHPSSEHQSDLAATYGNLGLLAKQAGDVRQAAGHFRSAIKIHEAIRHAAPGDAENLNHLATSYNNLAGLFISSQPEAARAWVERALTLQLQLAKSHPLQRVYQNDLALSFNNLGAIQSRLGKTGDAERCFRDAAALLQRLVSAAPLVAAYRRDLAVTWNNLGMAQMSAARELPEAEASFGKALALQQTLVSARTGDLTLQSGLGGIWNNLGLVRQKQGRLTDAATAFERAIDAQLQAYERAPDAVEFREALSKHYYNQAQVLLALDRPADAADAALARRRLWPNDPLRLVSIAEELAIACQRIPAGKQRQRYVAATAGTLRAAREAGLKRLPDLRSGAFAPLAAELGHAGWFASEEVE